MSSLAAKYRPTCFQDVLGQSAVVVSLKNQVEKGTYKNAYIFCGTSGSGKTSIAKLFAAKINHSRGTPIELDAASNNSVEDIKPIVDSAMERAIDCEYKVIIIDEAQSLGTGSATSSNKAWQPMLKLLENMPKYTIFIFCTTDPDKIPPAVKNRCQIHRFGKVSSKLIVGRLKFICGHEGFKYEDAAIEQIAKMSYGSVRQAITYLEKVSDYSDSITLKNVCESLGDFSYDIYFDLLKGLIDKDSKLVIRTIEKVDYSGGDLNTLLSEFITFIWDINKYILYGNMRVTSIPVEYEDELKEASINGIDYFNSLAKKMTDIKVSLRGVSNIKDMLEIMLIC